MVSSEFGLLTILILVSAISASVIPLEHKDQTTSVHSSEYSDSVLGSFEHFSLRSLLSPRTRIFFPDNVPAGHRRRKVKVAQPKGSEKPYRTSSNDVPRPQPGNPCPCPSMAWVQNLVHMVEQQLRKPTLINFPVDESTIVFDEKAGEAPPPNAVPYDWLENWLKLNVKLAGTRIEGKVAHSKSGSSPGLRPIKLKTLLETQARLIYQRVLDTIYSESE